MSESESAGQELEHRSLDQWDEWRALRASMPAGTPEAEVTREHHRRLAERGEELVTVAALRQAYGLPPLC